MIAMRQLERPYTIDDVADLPDDGRRYEIIGGELFVTPSPSSKHQLASTRLQLLIGSFLAERSIGEVFTAPYDVVFSMYDVLEPDLLVILNDQADIFTEAHVVGPPALVIEIISPSSRAIDRVRKSATYATYGVPEYWIVDPDNQTIVAQSLVDGVFQPIENDDELVHSRSVPDLVIESGKVFAPPAWDRASKA